MATPRSRAPAATRSWTRRLSSAVSSGTARARCASRLSGARGRRRAMFEPRCWYWRPRRSRLVCVRAHRLNPGRVVLLLRHNATKKGVGALTRGPIQSASRRRREERGEITGSVAKPERLAGWPKKKTGPSSAVKERKEISLPSKKEISRTQN